MSRPLAAVALACVLGACAPPPAPEASTPATPVTAWLGPDAAGAGFARAIEPGSLAFPADHGAHPAYRSTAASGGTSPATCKRPMDGTSVSSSRSSASR